MRSRLYKGGRTGRACALRVLIMSIPGLVAIVGLGVWLFLSIGFALDFPWIRRGVAWFSPFRLFGTWAMFAAGEGRKGAYGVAFRDVAPSGASGSWTTLETGHHWSWRVFLLDPRRVLADAVHATARELHRCLLQPATPAMAREVDFAQTRLRGHVRHLAPLAAGVLREIRVVKHLALGDVPDHLVICEFSDRADAER